MDKNLIVEIFVPKRGSNGKKGEIATGYPIGRDLILTARHVLCDDYDANFPIEIRWRYPEVDKSRWWPIERGPAGAFEQLSKYLDNCSYRNTIVIQSIR